MRLIKRHIIGPLVRRYVAQLQEHRDNLEGLRRKEIPQTIAYLDRKIAGWQLTLYRLNK